MSARPLRLLAFGLSWPPETFLQRKLCGLAAGGMDVTAAVRIYRGPMADLLPGVRTVAMGEWPGTIAAAARAPRRTARAVLDGVRYGSGPWQRRVRRVRNVATLLACEPDVVHFEWNSAAIDYLPFLTLWRAPVLISCRGTQILVRPHVDPPYADLLRATFDRARAVHCVCDAIRDEAVALGLDAAKAVVIRPAVDVAEFEPRAHRPRDEVHIAAVGAMSWRKGYEYMLAVVRGAVDRGVRARLSLVGTGPEALRVRTTVDDLGLRDHVTLLGARPPAEVRALLQDADLFLHTSLGEGISNAVLEAMACGLPVVTTDAGGMREAVTDGAEGFVTTVRDVGGAVRAVAMLAGDAGLRGRMGARARATAVARFSLADQLAAFRSLYERIAARPVGA